ncbi:MAG: chitobiase/beta-hexosaminidase C-terminal domain-containing protein [Polyangiaceae bacterium]|nr:chitobiase/beta-hexosaminidase C-terminal domain-containing protein [Polyangiaceae bacterium]
MRNLIGALSASALLLLAQASHAECVQDPISPTYPPINCTDLGTTMDCAYWQPPNNDPNTKYPLVIFLHGAGAVGTGDYLKPVDDGWTCQLQAVLAARNTNPAYVMVPRAVSSEYEASQAEGPALAFVTWNWGNQESYNVDTLPESPTLIEARSMLAGLQQRHPNIDPDRLYVVGVSMGGYGAWDMISRTPNLFAAGVPADGGGSPEAAARLTNMAVWSFHNADDGIVPSTSDRGMFQALALAGGRPYYTEGTGADHKGMVIPHDMNFAPWLFQQRRGVPSTPVSQLTFSPDGGNQLQGPVTVTITTTPPANTIYYTTDGTVPNALQQVGQLYTGPFTVNTSAIVMAAAHSTAEGDVTTFHAAPFQIGSTPLPNGVVAPPPGGGGTPGASGGAGNTGGAGPVNTGGVATGTGGSPAPVGSTGGNSTTVPQGTGGTGANPLGAAGGSPSGGVGSNGGQVSSPNRGAVKSGCTVTQAKSSATAWGGLSLALLGLLGLRRRRA